MCLPTKPFKIEREWEHAGLKCAVTQPREAGSRCGYVRVPPGHWAYGKDYNKLYDVDCHGGLTFAAAEPCVHEDGAGWWLGFDFGHAGDDSIDPTMREQDCTTEGGKHWLRMHREMDAKFPLPGGHYWTQVEVERECERLAEYLRRSRRKKKCT